MEKKLRYRTHINRCALGYQETKRVNMLLLEGLSLEEVERLVYEENVLQQTSVEMQKVVWKEISYRLLHLDKEARNLIQEEDSQSSKALVFYGVLQVDKLFREFCRAVYLDKLLTFHQEITKKEVIRFIEIQIEKDDRSMNWSMNTILKLAGTYIRTLKEAGALDSEQKIQRLVISPKTKNYLKEKGFQPAAEIVLGGFYEID